jgi:hypothetical protein
MGAGPGFPTPRLQLVRRLQRSRRQHLGLAGGRAKRLVKRGIGDEVDPVGGAGPLGVRPPSVGRGRIAGTDDQRELSDAVGLGNR